MSVKSRCKRPRCGDALLPENVREKLRCPAAAWIKHTHGCSKELKGANESDEINSFALNSRLQKDFQQPTVTLWFPH